MKKKQPKPKTPNHPTTKPTQNTPFQQDYERQDVGFSCLESSLSQLDMSPAQ